MSAISVRAGMTEAEVQELIDNFNKSLNEKLLPYYNSLPKEVVTELRKTIGN